MAEEDWIPVGMEQEYFPFQPQTEEELLNEMQPDEFPFQPRAAEDFLIELQQVFEQRAEEDFPIVKQQDERPFEFELMTMEELPELLPQDQLDSYLEHMMEGLPQDVIDSLQQEFPALFGQATVEIPQCQRADPAEEPCPPLI
ncbi:hypothetical protein CFC21_018546 [Triticum aestivum]|uniref:Uncharacterized protein n=3 Tax=Triticum TaxID=4564 RepID=A0A9R1P2W4_TRITD|nr:hypothetical protein CFC21_018546 [Triticum aestivum]VAH35589.1 unnamed protein product [Triticum turgidum subsp. durum]